MAFFDKREPWYIAGLAFECSGCGRCCAGPEEGYVWLNGKEVTAIAKFLGISEDEMLQKHVRRVGKRMSLREVKPSNDCIFLTEDNGNGRTCSIYPVRPTQCRTWPYWPGNLRRPEYWADAAMRCPGINRGDLHAFDEIEARRIETADD